MSTTKEEERLIERYNFLNVQLKKTAAEEKKRKAIEMEARKKEALKAKAELKKKRIEAKTAQNASRLVSKKRRRTEGGEEDVRLNVDDDEEEEDATIVAQDKIAGTTPGQGHARSSGSGGGRERFTVFVGGLNSTMTESDLRKVFSRFGEVTLVRTYEMKPFGFISFATKQAQELALATNGLVVNGSQVRVNHTTGDLKNRQSQQQQQQHQPNSVPSSALPSFPPPPSSSSSLSRFVQSTE